MSLTINALAPITLQVTAYINVIVTQAAYKCGASNAVKWVTFLQSAKGGNISTNLLFEQDWNGDATHN